VALGAIYESKYLIFLLYLIPVYPNCTKHAFSHFTPALPFLTALFYFFVLFPPYQMTLTAPFILKLAG
jgi:hypothetical protein